MATVVPENKRRYDPADGRMTALDAELQRSLAGRLPAVGAAQPPPLTKGSPAGEVVLGYVRDQVAAISRYDPLVRRDAPDAVHQMRVATRRARSALQAFGTIIEREATRPLCAELKWLAAALGAARDGEVMLDRLTADLAAAPPALVVGPVQARITAHFTAELAQAGTAALAALDGQRYLRLLDNLDALLADPPLTPPARRRAGKVLAKPVRRSARRLQRTLAAVPAAEDRDAAIHEARKATKRARYAAEAAAPALGSKASRQAAQAKELQQLLGDHHDSVVARAVLLDLAGKARAAGEDTFTYGLMHQRQACQAATMEQALPRFRSGNATGPRASDRSDDGQAAGWLPVCRSSVYLPFRLICPVQDPGPRTGLRSALCRQPGGQNLRVSWRDIQSGTRMTRGGGHLWTTAPAAPLLLRSPGSSRAASLSASASTVHQISCPPQEQEASAAWWRSGYRPWTKGCRRGRALTSRGHPDLAPWFFFLPP